MMLRPVLTIVAILATAQLPLHAESRTTCTAWEAGTYTVKIDGVTQNCTQQRTCTTTETDPDGQCRKAFGCHTTIEIQYGDCKKAATFDPGKGLNQSVPKSGVLDPGGSQPPGTPSGSTRNPLKAQ